jgi:hypothetical protein
MDLIVQEAGNKVEGPVKLKGVRDGVRSRAARDLEHQVSAGVGPGDDAQGRKKERILDVAGVDQSIGALEVSPLPRAAGLAINTHPNPTHLLDCTIVDGDVIVVRLALIRPTGIGEIDPARSHGLGGSA